MRFVCLPPPKMAGDAAATSVCISPEQLQSLQSIAAAAAGAGVCAVPPPPPPTLFVLTMELGGVSRKLIVPNNFVDLREMCRRLRVGWSVEQWDAVRDADHNDRDFDKDMCDEYRAVQKGTVHLSYMDSDAVLCLDADTWPAWRAAPTAVRATVSLSREVAVERNPAAVKGGQRQLGSAGGKKRGVNRGRTLHPVVNPTNDVDKYWNRVLQLLASIYPSTSAADLRLAVVSRPVPPGKIPHGKKGGFKKGGFLKKGVFPGVL